MKINPNEPAYPREGTPVFDAEGRPQNPYGVYGWSETPQAGLTIRAEFAKEMMKAIIISGNYGGRPQQYAERALEMADALIAELNKEVK